MASSIDFSWVCGVRFYYLLIFFINSKNMCSNHQKKQSRMLRVVVGGSCPIKQKDKSSVYMFLRQFRYISTNLTDQHDESSSVRPMLEINLDYILISHRLSFKSTRPRRCFSFLTFMPISLSLSHHTTIPHFANRCSSQFQTVICNNLP